MAQIDRDKGTKSNASTKRCVKTRALILNRVFRKAIAAQTGGPASVPATDDSEVVPPLLYRRRLNFEAGKDQGRVDRTQAQRSARLFGHECRSLFCFGNVLRSRDLHAIELH